MKKVRISTTIWMFLLVAGAAYGINPGQYADDSHTLALYHLNQSSGTTVIDDASSGRTAHNGTVINGAPNWTTGDFGNGLGVTFGGSTGINCGPLTGSTSNYTIEFYFKWNYAYADPLGNLFYAQEAAFARSNLVDHGAQAATYYLDYGVRKGDGGWYQIGTAADNTLDTNWHHLAFTRTWDGVNTGCKIYVDGVEKASGGFAGGYWDPGLDVIMPFNSSMGGTFDEIRFSNVARTASELGVPPRASDINKSGFVDFKDFALLAKDWMTCSDPMGLDCINCNELVFAPSTVDAGTVALWHLDEGAGTTAYDETSNHYPLTVNASGSEYSWSLGRFEKGLNVTGANTSYCKSSALPIANTSTMTNQMTVSAWIKPTGVSTDGSYAVSTNDSSFLRLNGSSENLVVEAGFHEWRTGYYTGGWTSASKSVGAIDGNWHHIAGVYNGLPDGNGNANIYLYWDGVLVATTSVLAVDPDPAHAGRAGLGLTLVDTGTGELNIGGSGAANQSFQGMIDEVKVDNVARTKFFGTACE